MERSFWPNWAQTLHQKSMIGFVLTVLEGSGPVKVIFSQVVYAFLPFLNRNASPSLKAFAEMMENPTESKLFADYLRQENQV